MGPRSRELLARLTDADLANAGVPVRHLARDLARLRAGARRAHHLRRRARLGALRARGVRGRRVRRARRRGRRPGPAPRGLSRHGLAAHREGLPLVGPRPRQRGHAARGRPRLRGAPGQGRAVPRPRGARSPSATRRSRAASPSSSWTTPSRSCTTTSRSGATARWSAASRPAPTATPSAARSGLGWVEHADGVGDAFVESGRLGDRDRLPPRAGAGPARAAVRSEVASRARVAVRAVPLGRRAAREVARRAVGLTRAARGVHGHRMSAPTASPPVAAA